MKTAILSALLLSTLIPAAAHAQYTGPTKIPAGTVADVLKNAKDDDKVKLTGKIIHKSGDEMYLFADATGEIVVEIDDKLFVAPVSEATMVEIHGEVDKHMFKPTEIDVDKLIIVQ